jgi:hypothetical protein
MTIFESFVVVVGLRAAPTDILTDLSSIEGHARAHIGLKASNDDRKSHLHTSFSSNSLSLRSFTMVETCIHSSIACFTLNDTHLARMVDLLGVIKVIVNAV